MLKSNLRIIYIFRYLEEKRFRLELQYQIVKNKLYVFEEYKTEREARRSNRVP